MRERGGRLDVGLGIVVGQNSWGILLDKVFFDMVLFMIIDVLN